jgi:hypothetical protein
MDFEFHLLAAIQIALVFGSGFWYMRRNDEAPLIVSAAMLLFGSYRYWSVSNGFGEWISSWETFGLKFITEEDALEALAVMILGELVFLGSYMLNMGRSLPVIRPELTPLNKPSLVKLLLFMAFICVFAANWARESTALVIESSYVFLFPLALIGVSSLLITVWLFGGFQNLFQKLVCVVILAAIAYYSFGVLLRFQFFGWVAAAGVILSSIYAPKKRALVLGAAMVVGVVCFSVSGSMRSDDILLAEGQTINRFDDSVQRLLRAEDANMLDGFVMVQQAYPKLIDYGWGTEHLEILTRPIPRSWWPDKPVGGYINKLGLTYANAAGNIGISPSLFGSFYGEGGYLGIVIFSVIYGLAISGFTKRSTSYHPFVYVVLRASTIACLFPLIRGGDLPGIYAWFGMSLWPCLIFVWLNRKEFFPKKRLAERSPGVPAPLAGPSPMASRP